MNYDLVISDFDGTLLRSDDTISERTAKAVADFVAAGGVFGISTGRAYASIVQRLAEVGLVGNFPVMSCQGAVSCDSVTGEVISEIPMPRDAAIEFVVRAHKMGLVAQFYTATEIYAPELNEINDEYFRKNRLSPIAAGDLGRTASRLDEPIYKALCFIDPADRAKVIAAMSDIKGVKVFASHAMLVEAVSEKAGKGNGLRATCERLGIDIRRSVAIGDELNDVEMLEAAGLGVAVGNAVPECKAVADYVTDSCDADGVAKVLEKIIKNEELRIKN